MSKNNLKEQQLANECNRRACELVKEKYLDLKVAKVVDEYKDWSSEFHKTAVCKFSSYYGGNV